MIFENQFSKKNPMVLEKTFFGRRKPMVWKTIFQGSLRKHFEEIYHGFLGKSVFSNEKFHEFRKIT